MIKGGISMDAPTLVKVTSHDIIFTNQALHVQNKKEAKICMTHVTQNGVLLVKSTDSTEGPEL